MVFHRPAIPLFGARLIAQAAIAASQSGVALRLPPHSMGMHAPLMA